MISEFYCGTHDMYWETDDEMGCPVCFGEKSKHEDLIEVLKDVYSDLEAEFKTAEATTKEDHAFLYGFRVAMGFLRAGEYTVENKEEEVKDA